VAIYDYALYNETLLGNESIIISDAKHRSTTEIRALLKFTNRFRVFFHEDKKDLENIFHNENCDILYVIKYGKRDELEIPVRTVIHCVFDLSDPHGNVYAAVSKTLAQKYGYPLYVPHMVGLTPSTTGENMRKELGIPQSARVFGRYGGKDTFDIPFVIQSFPVLLQQSDIYFLFANTPKFIDHPRVFFLDPFTDMGEKNRFIQTCDAHLECGTLGHTFGLAMAEFSVNNKPIIAFKGHVWNTAHYDILGDKALYFSTKEEFVTLLSQFDPRMYETRDNNCYKDFSPSKVMEIFDKVFIHESIKKNT
jgi:hypothetical protein